VPDGRPHAQGLTGWPTKRKTLQTRSGRRADPDRLDAALSAKQDQRDRGELLGAFPQLLRGLAAELGRQALLVLQRSKQQIGRLLRQRRLR